jgi:hypothetical protein
MKVEMDSPPEHVPALVEWLRREDIDGLLVQARTGSPAADEMGVDISTIEVLLATPAVVALAQSLSTWLQTRRSHVKLRIRRGDTSIEIDSSNVAHAEALLTKLFRLEG